MDQQRVGWRPWIALLIGALLCLHGIEWGESETWHPDQMAFQQLLAPERGPLEPAQFEKPPFHTYFNFFLSVVPLKALDWTLERATGQAWNGHALAVWWSKILQVALFLATVCLMWACARRIAGERAAMAVALVCATSAGFVVQAHFLTADVPVTCWMVLSFYFAQRILAGRRIRDYALAGAAAGLATATKYNGLAVGIAIPVFHAFATLRHGSRAMLLSRRLALGIAMVGVGFIAANPYALLDFRRFAEDFIYNYVVTPVYDAGFVSGTSFDEVLPRLAEIIGWPGLALVAVALGRATIGMRRSLDEPARASLAGAAAVAALYIAKFAAAPRLETRFILPVVPFLLIPAALGWRLGAGARLRLWTGGLALLLAYNVLSSYWVGRRFAEDARMQALAWVARTVSDGSTFESDRYSPHWNAHRAIHVEDRRMPHVPGRRRRFLLQFKEHASLVGLVQRKEQDGDLGWYTPQALAARRPDYVALNSLAFDRFLTGPGAALYPEMNGYLAPLLEGALGYEVVFESVPERSPRWLYPQRLDFVDCRVVILRRADLE